MVNKKSVLPGLPQEIKPLAAALWQESELKKRSLFDLTGQKPLLPEGYDISARWQRMPEIDELAFMDEEQIRQIAQSEAEENKATWIFYNNVVNLTDFDKNKHKQILRGKDPVSLLFENATRGEIETADLKQNPLPDDTVVIRCLNIKLKQLPGDTVLSKTLRACDPKFIRRVLRRHVRRAAESAGLWLGIVGKKRHEYCSDYTLRSRIDIDNAAEQWASRRQIKCENATLPLIDILKKADQNRASERYVLNKYICELAKNAGYIGFFITATCPPEMHPNPSNGNDNWDGTLPDEAAKWLQKRFARVRALLAKNKIEYTGCWTKEPHADGCPHMHFVFFYKPKMHNGKSARHIVAQSFVKHFRHSKNALEFKEIDWEKGNPASYAFKYIQKATGITPDGDDPSNFARVRAAQKAWRFRTFGYFGLNSTLTTWRMCRKLNEKEANRSEHVAAMAEAAKNNDWAGFFRRDSARRGWKGARTPALHPLHKQVWRQMQKSRGPGRSHRTGAAPDSAENAVGNIDITKGRDQGSAGYSYC
ncbi:replication endonuclease [Methylocaldum szegediense]|uniref:Replication gene A protein-like domain-containing protein n=1 Tax=Methylocaldum szegediense TaxID=73780 RepID=A0ABM9I248_9GAMM|nr:replication endonuclease [Methylocaldum szegediense]CAI8830889.1 protein of unknown function [Methylocaldum szegediense]